LKGAVRQPDVLSGSSGSRTGVFFDRAGKLAISRATALHSVAARGLLCLFSEEAAMSQNTTIDPEAPVLENAPALEPVKPSSVRAQPKQGAKKKQPKKRRS
jgi:hypothetical protein